MYKAYILYFVMFLEFLKFSTPSQNVEVHINLSYVEIGLPKVLSLVQEK